MTRNTINVIPKKQKNSEIPEFAGDYVLDKVVLINHLGYKVDVKHIMLELNIYESIYKSHRINSDSR
jgi:2',3'-cyclic-nucleotide 2'-phosphodiesterase (5'-nucleotidase family)